MFKFKDNFKNIVQNNDVIVIAGDTGCGKSTQIPQYLIELGFKNITCTQPRRIACISLCKRVAYELKTSSDMQNYINTTFGDSFFTLNTETNLPQNNTSIGYQIRFDKTYFSHPKNILTTKNEDDLTRKDSFNKLLFMTEGILLRQLGTDPNLSGYDCILIDEVHERHCTTDFILGSLKCILSKFKFSKTKPNFKLILMSATINTQLFVDYFDKCAFLQVPGRLYPIELVYVPLNDESNVRDNKEMLKVNELCNPEPYVRLLKSIDQKYGSPLNQPGDVLIFLPGVQEINNVASALKEYSFDKGFQAKVNAPDPNLIGNSNHWVILPLHASLSTHDQDMVFDITPAGYRKCVLATNVAETSVTIDGIRFVIDSGKVKELHYDPLTKMSRLKTFWISKAGAEQRKGRAGRTGPGICYRLYDHQKHFEQTFKDFSLSEISKVPIHCLVLQILALGDGLHKINPELTNSFAKSEGGENDALDDKGDNNEKCIGEEFFGGDIKKFPFIEPPDPSTLDASIAYLSQHGALTILQDDKVELTNYGRLLARLPLDITVAKMLMNAYFLNVDFNSTTKLIDITLTLSAIFSIRSIFNAKANRDVKAFCARQSLQSPQHGDPFTLFNLFNHWIKLKIEDIDYSSAYMNPYDNKRSNRDHNKSNQDSNSSNRAKRWCRKVGVEEQRLYEVLKLRKQFGSLMKREFSNKRQDISHDNVEASADKPEIGIIKRLKRERLTKSGRVKVLKIRDKETAGHDNKAHSKEDTSGAEEIDSSSDIDIEDMELKYVQNDDIKKLYVPEMNSEDIAMVKFVLLSGFYPHIAIPDQFDTFKRGSDLIYHTKEKPFVAIHPHSSLTLEPELYLAKGPQSDTILLSYASLLETTAKPNLLNPLTLQHPFPYMNIFCDSIIMAVKDLGSSSVDKMAIEIIYDNWCLLKFKGELAFNKVVSSLCVALAIRQLFEILRDKLTLAHSLPCIEAEKDEINVEGM
ncbi:unnamed protein product [Gordionus sp. m RMFG-2023]